MKVQGSQEVALAREAVFDRLLDPGFLQQCIPGCETLDEVAPGRYEIQVRSTARVGNFRGTATVSDALRAEGYTLVIEGKSTVGVVRSVASLRLEAVAGGTRLHYQGEAKFSGMFARLGARLMEPAAERLATEFFQRLSDQLLEP